MFDMTRRASGILLHITSLPSAYGIGDLGPAAYRFADFLADSGQRYWQVLPLNYTHQAHGNSPYSSMSCFAGNITAISPELMVQEGLLTIDDAASVPRFPGARVNYKTVIAYKTQLFHKAFQRFRNGVAREGFDEFCAKHAPWLDDFALFVSARADRQGALWTVWPAAERDREHHAVDGLKARFAERIDFEKFLQFIFFRQWENLKKYCNGKEIRVIGDIPIYVSYDSVDIWTDPRLFKLNAEKQPLFVSGVPPDYFSATGQRWGNPVYDWERMRSDGFAWWMRRMEHNFLLYDVVRVDHFRGFAAYWEIPAGEESAVNGKWVPAPGEEFFQACRERFGPMPVIAEDLGIITDDVKALKNKFCFPGMKILLFAFSDGSSENAYLPENFDENCVVYTGTHDNNTARGWFTSDASPEEKAFLEKYLGRPVKAPSVARDLIEIAMASRANTAIFPLQDVLNLDGAARMNLPGTTEDNWQWRFTDKQLTSKETAALAELTAAAKRG